jgi:uridylate kinase
MPNVYKRIMLKLSGEALAGTNGYGIDPAVADGIAKEIKRVYDDGVQIGIVLGGGNIFRGLAGAARGISRTAGDTVGMLATLINSLLFKEALKKAGAKAEVLSAVQIDKAAVFFTADRALDLMNNGSIVIIAAGTGNPYFTTDTAAALRCAELGCEVMMKATKVDGIYDSDPAKNKNAVKIPVLTHQEALARNLKVMDSTAFSLCMDNNIPILVFRLTDPDALYNCVNGKPVGSIVKKGD